MSTQQKQSNSHHFIIQSETDNKIYKVNRNIINSSTLLKNICAITKVNQPIMVKCSSESLKFYINLNNQYQSLKEKHDIKFETKLFNHDTSKDKQKLIALIQDLWILDSDFFMDSVADYILGILGNDEKEMDWNEIQEYLGLENDFSENERKMIEKDEYFLSIDTEDFKFPFPNKSLYSLKTDFSTPMNALIARIVLRSNEKISYLLSIINKTLKNEVDRHPLKVYSFYSGPWHWNWEIKFKKRRNLNNLMEYKNYPEKLFNTLKKRKIVTSEASASYSKNFDNEFSNQSISLDFVISNLVVINISDSYKCIYNFDVSKCPMSSIFYQFFTVRESGIKFEEVYNQLIAKAVSKKIILATSDFFNITDGRSLLKFIKRPNASNFHVLQIREQSTRPYLGKEFKELVTKYMEDDGIVQTRFEIEGIDVEKTGVKITNYFLTYPVLLLKKHLDSIIIKQ